MKMFCLNLSDEKVFEAIESLEKSATIYTKVQILLLKLVRSRSLPLSHIEVVLDSDEFEAFSKTYGRKLYPHSDYSFDLNTKQDHERFLGHFKDKEKIFAVLKEVAEMADTNEEFFQVITLFHEFMEGVKSGRVMKTDWKTYFQYLNVILD